MKKFEFSSHAVKQMFKRNINEDAVLYVIENGEIIKTYPDDKPHPSFLILGFYDSCPLHIVVAYDNTEDTYIIVTAYVPKLETWNNDFKTKKS